MALKRIPKKRLKPRIPLQTSSGLSLFRRDPTPTDGVAVALTKDSRPAVAEGVRAAAGPRSFGRSTKRKICPHVPRRLRPRACRPKSANAVSQAN